MSKINAEWHARNRMPRNATLDERVAWHVEHARVCACRPIPATVQAVLRTRDQTTTQQRRVRRAATRTQAARKRARRDAPTRAVIMWNLITIDGFFERKRWDIDFHESAWGEELERFSVKQLESADLLLFGRVTYEGMASYWPTATGKIAELMNGIPKIVFSGTLHQVAWQNTRLVSERAEVEVARLKQQPGKAMLLFGSAQLGAALTAHRLIDEYRLGLTPIVLAGGNPLFKSDGERVDMKLIGVKPLQSGCVILRYQPAGP